MRLASGYYGIRMCHQGLREVLWWLDQLYCMGRVLASQKRPHLEDECSEDKDAQMDVWIY